MVFALPRQEADDFADTFVALAAGEGSGSHPYLHSAELNAGAEASRNLADTVHHLSTLHARPPGLIEIAGGLGCGKDALGWYMAAAAGFAVERAYLAALVVASGAMPSTPGQAGCEQAMAGQQRAMETLARSDRAGVALGAAAALVLDWQAIRAVLDTAADRLGVEVPACALPGEEQTIALVVAAADGPAAERAVLFGGRQLWAHHHGLWTLLDARQSARSGSPA